MIEPGFPGCYPMDSDDDGNDIQIWEEPAPQTSKSRAGSHNIQWTAPNFRPGTAPEVTVNSFPGRAFGNQGKDLSSPPTTLSETNFALKMAARSSSCGYRESPDFTRTAMLKRRVVEKKRAKTPLTSNARSVRSPGMQAKSSVPDSPYVVDASPGNFVPKPAPAPKPSPGKSPQTSSHRTVVDAALHVPHGGKSFKPPSANPRDTPTEDQRSGTKQRKAASARISRQPVPEALQYDKQDQEVLKASRSLPVFNPTGEEEDGLFQKRREYPQRPPSRHREPGQSLGLDVHPQPPRRLQSAHFPSHHERPPSRCKPPNQALHLEDKFIQDTQPETQPSAPATETVDRGSGWVRDSQAVPVPLDVEEAAQDDSSKGVPSPDREDIVPSAEDTKRREWSAGLQRPAAPSSKHKPKAKPHIAQVPFRTSLSPDFLCLFAQASANTPPSAPHGLFAQASANNHDPTVQVGLAYNNYSNGLLHSGLFSDCFSMGMSDIPSPEHDQFESRHLEDLCISEDESKSESD